MENINKITARLPILGGNMNQMWILKDAKDILKYDWYVFPLPILQHHKYDLSTLHTNIPRDQLKSRMADIIKRIIKRCFVNKNGIRRFKYLVSSIKNLTLSNILWNTTQSHSSHKYTANDIINIFINIFVEFGGHVFQQAVDIATVSVLVFGTRMGGVQLEVWQDSSFPFDLQLLWCLHTHTHPSSWNLSRRLSPDIVP